MYMVLAGAGHASWAADISDCLSSPTAKIARSSASLQEYDIYFVNGFMREFVSSEPLESWIATLKHEFSLTGPVRELRTTSLSSVEANVAALRIQLQSLDPKRPKILVGHSKGAAEILILALRNRSLIEDFHIDKILLVQGALQGSSLAAIGSDICQMPSTVHLCRQLALGTEAVRSLEPARMKKTVKTALDKLDAPDREWLGRRIFYLRSEIRKTDAVMPFWLTNRILYSYLGVDSDGVMTPDEQKLNALGHDLGIIDADHVSLLVKKSSQEPSLYPRLVRCTMDALGLN